MTETLAGLYTRTVSALAQGKLVGRYELVLPIAGGGDADVWLARRNDDKGGQLVALKCWTGREASDAARRATFVERARALQAIDHANVARVIEAAETSAVAFMAMEYVDGSALRELVGHASSASSAQHDGSVIPTDIALRIIEHVCAGLQAVHELPDPRPQPGTTWMIHGDLSYDSVVVDTRGEVKLVGFAMPRVRAQSDASRIGLAPDGLLRLSAPEVSRGERLGPSTDVFATGVLLLGMLIGPRRGASVEAGAAHDDPAAVLQHLPAHVPQVVRAILVRALARDPADRYPGALAMGAALSTAISSAGDGDDVATWVRANMSEAMKARRAQLAAAGLATAPMPVKKPAPMFDAELGSPLDRAQRAPLPAPAARPIAPRSLDLDSEPPETFGDDPAGAIGLELTDVARGGRTRRALDPNDPASAEHKDPGMLDVRALIAQRRGAPQAAIAGVPRDPRDPPAAARNAGAEPAAPTPNRGAHERVAAHATAPRETPLQAPRHGAVDARDERGAEDAASAVQLPDSAAKRARAGNSAGGRTWLVLAVVAVVAVSAIALVLLLLPGFVRSRIITGAQKHGVELGIGRVGLGLGGVTLRDVTARSKRIPGAVVRIDEMVAAGWKAREIHVRGVDLALSGPAADAAPTIARFYEEMRPHVFAIGEDGARRIFVVGARARWEGFLGQGTRIDASDITGEVESRGTTALPPEDVRASVGRLVMTTTHTTLGPWAASFEKKDATSRLRVSFDPASREGPSALAIWKDEAFPHVTVNVPRAPLSRLGARSEDFGLPSTAEIALELSLGQSPTMRIEGSGHAAFFGIRAFGAKTPLDVSIEGNVLGMPGKPLELERATATMGPFVAIVNGTLTRRDFGFRLDTTWQTLPIPCDKLARAEAKSLGPLALVLQELARKSGVVRVTGTAHASGTFVYDTQAPDGAGLTMATKETCGLSLFGR